MLTIDEIRQGLKDNGYIVQLSTRGKYSLTDKANIEIDKMSNKEVI